MSWAKQALVGTAEGAVPIWAVRLFCEHGVAGLQLRNQFEKSLHAMSGFQNGIDLGMAPAIGVENQNARTLMRFLHHIRKMMAIVARECRPQNHEIERVTVEAALPRLYGSRRWLRDVRLSGWKQLGMLELRRRLRCRESSIWVLTWPCRPPFRGVWTTTLATGGRE